MDLSIVIPAFNEAERLPATLVAIHEYVKTSSRSTEVIVVDDGSTDGTADIAAQAPFPVRVIRQPKNLGKGAAVRTGMAAAEGEWRYLCDADLSTPIQDLDTLWAVRDQADIILGSRRVAGAHIEKHQSWLKETLGRGGNWLIQLLIAPGIQDTQCGFKLFHRRTAPLFRQQRINRWGYDFEILYLARMAKLKIREVTVHWANDERSKVRNGDYLKTLLELATIFLNRARGFYRLS
jgi:dolichyl-phosphate beta-glucosyltransferase